MRSCGMPLDSVEIKVVDAGGRELPPRAEIVAEIRRTLEANAMRDNVHIRLTLTRGVKITSGMDPRLNQSWLGFAGFTSLAWLTGGIAAVLLARHQRRERSLA